MIFALSAAALAQPVVALVSPGAEPREELRLSPPLGLKEAARLDLTLSARTQSAGATLPPSVMPPLSIELGTEVLSVDEAVTYRVTVTGVHTDASRDLGAAMEEAMLPLVGLSGTAVVDTHGRHVSEDWSAVEGVDAGLVDELRKSLAVTMVPLPVEPVGVGAQWTITRPVDGMGFHVTQVETYTLQERTAEQVTLTSQITQQAEAGQPVTQGLPESTTATLASHLSVGEAKVVLDAGHLLPREALEGMTTKYKLIMVRDGEEVPMSTIVGHEMALRRSVEPHP